MCLKEKGVYSHNCNKFHKTFMLSENISPQFINRRLPNPFVDTTTVRLGRLEIHIFF